MADRVTVEIVGFSNSECGPFPCDEHRTCGLDDCAPYASLTGAFTALEARLRADYGDRVETKLTLLDDGVPEYVREIVDRESPPLPLILVNGRLRPIGRISVDPIKREIDLALAA
ncbi:MAG: hypothetical protein GXY82_10190 [Methanospirillum sp.]|nr:hypothetical protein [Methanospirillum sp.]